MLGMQPVDYVVIDGPIQHGYITCWKGFTEKVLKNSKSLKIKLIEPQSSDSIISPPEPLPELIDPQE